MRQFLNVLYRRILYKIPLKLLLVILAVVSVFIACTQASFEISPLYVSYQRNASTQHIYWEWVPNSDTFCIIDTMWTFNVDFDCVWNYTTLTLFDSLCVSNSEYSDNWHEICLQSINWNYEVWVLYYSTNTLDTPMTSLECQTEYNLIPISSVDSSYCTTNNLCPSNSCPVGSWWVSSLYINDILHVGAPFIYMDIPQEIGWDYVYTQWWTNMIIDVEWYNVDYDKIEGIVNTQSYTPDEYDLNSIITNVIPLFVPWLVIILFIYFIFRLIKKIF